MSRPAIHCRRDSFEIIPLDTMHTDNARYRAAELASEALRQCAEALGVPASIEPRTLTFEEQLALVQSGKARVVTAIPIRKADPDYTLGGVSW